MRPHVVGGSCAPPPARTRLRAEPPEPSRLPAIAQGDTVILHCHWLSFLRDVHSYLAVIAVIFCQNVSVALGYPEPSKPPAASQSLPTPSGWPRPSLGTALSRCAIRVHPDPSIICRSRRVWGQACAVQVQQFHNMVGLVDAACRPPHSPAGWHTLPPTLFLQSVRGSARGHVHGARALRGVST